MKSVRLIAWALVLVVGAVYLSQFLKQDIDQPYDGPGGPFTLTSHTGATVSDQDFRGQHMLVYFGYSFCPDVCPLELQKMTAALLSLENEGYDTNPLQPLFISVDPERDTPDVLAEYVPLFHPRLLGLTGTLAETTELAGKYKVYFKKREAEDIDGYLMDHLSVIFLMDQDGQYQKIYTSNDTPDDIAASLKPLLTKTS